MNNSQIDNIEKKIRSLGLREPFSARCVHRALPELEILTIAAHLRKNSSDQRHKPRMYVKVFRGWFRMNTEAT